MKSYIKDVTEWLAQRLIAMAIPRAIEIIEEASGREQAPRQLAAPKMPEIEVH